MPSRSLRAPLGAATLLLAGLTPLAVAPARAATPTCEGQAATLVGSPGRSLLGTDGADVVVTNGADSVRTLGGDDVVCITGPASRARPVFVRSGGGDDRVLDQVAYRTAPQVDQQYPVSVDLGAGDDLYRDGPAPEQVIDPSGTADIVAAGRDDSVFAGGIIGSKADGPFDGSVRVGGPGGVVSVAPNVDAGTTLVGVPGVSTLMIDGFDDADWAISAADGDTAGTVDLRGTRRFDVDGLTRFVLPFGTVSDFVGGESADALDVRTVRNASTGGGDDEISALSIRGTVDLGPGADRLDTTDFAAGAVLDGGSGRDLLTEASNRFTDVDAAHGFLSRGLPSAPAYRQFPMTGFERYVLIASGHWAATFEGSDAPESVRLLGCLGTVSAGGGDDRVFVGQLANDPRAGASCPNGTSLVGAGQAGDDELIGGFGRQTLKGGYGTDRLSGGRGSDFLLGSKGRDVAEGGRGADRCRAEVRRSCER